MQTCSLNTHKKLLLLVLISFNFTEAQSFSLDDAVKIALKNKEALKAFYYLTEKEGISPALETAHALAYAFKIAKKRKNKNILINLSGRGDQDIDTIAKLTQMTL